MKITQLALLPVAITLALTGCGGSGDDSGSNGGSPVAPTYEVSGNLSATNAAMPFTVCADIDRNWSCDSNEPSVQSEHPAFVLKSADIKIKTSPLLVVASLAHGEKSATAGRVRLATPAVGESQASQINGITTLVMGEMLLGSNQEQAVASVAANLSALGIPVPADLLAQSDDAALADIDRELVTVLANMAKRSESYDTLVAGTTKGLAIYGQSILDGTLSERHYDELASLGAIAQRGHNDTGLTKSLNLATGQMTEDADPGAPGQDASYGLDVTDGGFKFVKLDGNGQPLADDSTQWQCVKDERTGLVWEHKADDRGSYRDKHRQFAFETASHKPHPAELAMASCQSDGLGVCSTQEYVDRLNEARFCGKSNWRLPTFNEQFDLLDFGETATDASGNTYGLDVAYFDDLVTGAGELPYGMYWSSTQMRSDPAYTTGKQIPLLSQMTVIEDSTMLGDISAGYSVCEASQSEECYSPTVIQARMVAQ